MRRNNMIESTRFIPTNRLKQYNVVNKSDEDMGQVQTFVVDMIAGRIAFVVVSFEGFLGISDKWFALPWELLNWSIENKKFILDMSKEILEKAPGMDKNKWPDEINFELIGKSYAHFGVVPYWEIPDASSTVISGVVTPATTLSSIAIMPALPASLAVGSTQQFTATGTYSDKSLADITSKVTWSSSDTSIATISSTGLAVAVGIGITGIANIRASMSGVTSPVVNLRTVSAPKFTTEKGKTRL
jgi:uncharacterized protein YjdB